MKKRANTQFLVLSLVLVAFACKKEAPAVTTLESPSADAHVTAAPPASAPSSAAVVEASPEAPTEEDFEAEADRTISATNMDQELDRLEKEIADP